MADSTRTYDLPIKPSWFQGGTKHHIYIKAPLARALGARHGGASVRVAVYVDGANCANGCLQGTTCFLTEVDAAFDALGISASDADKRVVCAQGRTSTQGHALDLHLWIPRSTSMVAHPLGAPDPESLDNPPVAQTNPSAEAGEAGEAEDARSGAQGETLVDVDDDYSDELAPEGSLRQILVNAYERSPELRRRCIEHWGLKCVICTFNFEATYGALGRGYVHVHHLKPLAEVRAEHEVDPVQDLRPLCANCHSIIHRRRPARALAEVIAAVQAARDAVAAQPSVAPDGASRRR